VSGGALRSMRPGRAQHLRRAGVGLAAAGAGAGLLYRRYTTPFPYAPWALDRELPFLDRRRLVEILEPRPGERVLEIGPGTGLFSLPVARALGPTGRLDVFDIQQEMLDHTLRVAGEQGIANLTATRGDARELPFADGSFDAAFMVTVLGEIPSWGRALGELRRVLRPGGRLVVGEFLLDWHAVPLALLCRRAGAAGLRLERRSGPPVSYLARLSAV
jgi:SAM-dependent methyltransferase